MKRRKLGKRLLFFLLFVAIGYGIYYAWVSFPIISGFNAKNACSCAFIQGRTIEDISKEELGSFPLSIGSVEIDYTDSSVTGAVLGTARRKAIFRTGLGCTLVSDFPEAVIRAQSFSIPQVIVSQDSIDWPAGDRLVPDSVVPLDKTKLDSALTIAFQPEYKDKKVSTKAVLIAYKGSIVAEQYAPGYSKESKLLGWSMAKSVTGALIGILVKEGKLKVDEPAPVAAWNDKKDKRRNIILEHLLQQRSGLDFEESYSKYSSATNMLFNKGDMAGFVANLPLKLTPGSKFYYSSGNSNVLSGIIRTTVGEKNYHAFPYNALFHKTGMYHTLLEPDASGTYVGSSYIYASTRDYARFGLLYLNDGVWNGERILPEGWVRQTVHAPDVFKERDYGYQFWLNGWEVDDAGERQYPELPADAFLADGYGGQRIYIIPSKELVIVRLGLNKFDEHRFLKTVMKALQ